MKNQNILSDTSTNLDQSLNNGRTTQRKIPSSNYVPEKILQKISVTCSYGKKGYGYCLDCKNPAVICNDEQCKCYKQHISCKKIRRVSNFSKLIDKKLKNSNILSNISTIISEIIESVSSLESNILNKFQTFGLNQADKTIGQKILYHSKGNYTLTSTDFHTYDSSYDEQQKKWFFEQTDSFKQIIEDLESVVRKKLNNIKNMIYYEHMKNVKDINAVAFTDSAIFDKDDKNRALMLQMIKQLGNLSKAEKIYTTSKDSFKLNSFYSRCQNHQNLLYVIKNSKQKIYGGFCPNKIDSKHQDYYTDKSYRTFLFDLEQNMKSKIISPEKALKICKLQMRNDKNQQPNYFLLFGDEAYPNLVVSEDSLKNKKLNFITFNTKSSSSAVFERKTKQKNTSNYYYESQTLHRLAEFQVYELFFHY